MDHFRNAKSIRLKSHHEKYLVAEKDEETVSQDRNGSSKTTKWNVEFIHGGEFIRFKSCYGKYLTASNASFLLGMTGRKVLQTLPKTLDSSIEWEPIRDGVQIKLKTRYGNYLRANGGLPPWRNSVTHDVPHRSSSQDSILWEVDILDMQVQLIGNAKEEKEDKPKGKKQAAGVLKRSKEKKEGKLKDEKTEEEESKSEMANAKEEKEDKPKGKKQVAGVLKLKEESESEMANAKEEKEDKPKGKKQAAKLLAGLLKRPKEKKEGKSKDEKTEEEVEEEEESEMANAKEENKDKPKGNKQAAKLLAGLLKRLKEKKEGKSKDEKTEEEVEEEEEEEEESESEMANAKEEKEDKPKGKKQAARVLKRSKGKKKGKSKDEKTEEEESESESGNEEGGEGEGSPNSKFGFRKSPHSRFGFWKFPRSEPNSLKLTKQESSDSFVSSSFKVDGRKIFYYIADENGDYDDGIQGSCFIFKGNSVSELTQKLKEETGIEDIIVCTKSLLTGMLCPLRLHLPPNNATMNVVVVEASSRVGRSSANPGL